VNFESVVETVTPIPKRKKRSKAMPEDTEESEIEVTKDSADDAKKKYILFVGGC